MPQRSTAWRLHAKGIDSETLAGEGTEEVITKKSLFAELKLPTAFTAGDHVRVPVEIHLAEADKRKVTVKLKATVGTESVEQTRDVELAGNTITPVEFEFEIDVADEVLFQVTLLDGDEVIDQSSQAVMIRPFGFPVYRTAGGTSSQSTLALLAFDSSLKPQGVQLQLSVGPSLNRWLIDSVLGHDAFLIDRCLGPAATPIERSTSDILGGVSVAQTLHESLEAQHPEIQAVQSRIVAAISHLVAAQNDQGGWSWSGSTSANEPDPYLSARVMWAWSVARDAGFPVPQAAFDLGKTYLKSAFASSPPSDLERQAILLHAMSVSSSGDFALANRLYRERNRLGQSGLIHLVLTMDALQHPEMASDLLELVKPPTDRDNGNSRSSRPSFTWLQDPVELQAMYLLALQAVRPESPTIEVVAKSLLASRIGSRWPIEKANGPAIAALSTWLGRGQSRSEKYRLKISVNDQALTEWTVDPAVDGSRLIDVPADWLVSDKPQRIEFELEGRATFSYSAVLSGFVAAEDIKSSTQTWTVSRRYEPQPILFAGRPIPRGFDVVDGSYQPFTNPLTQLPVGRRAEITLSPRRHLSPSERNQNQDYLVLTEPIPAGTTVLAGSVRGSFERYEVQAGNLVFFIGNQRYPGNIHYTLVGYVPGKYRVAPSLLRNFYNPDDYAVGTIKDLDVLDSGSRSPDEYRLSPDELYYLGEAEFKRGNHEKAHQHLSELYANWQLDPDKQKNAVQWLFESSLAKHDHGDTVRYFEVLKEKFPDVEISFEEILQVASSYREIGEYERGYLVYRATVEGSFERESQVAGFLNVQGEFARSVQEMERLLRDYPAESYLATATYALAQETYRRAAAASEDETLRSQGLTRVHLIDAAIKMLDHFITMWPDDPANDEASFALATALIDLEQYEAVIDRSQRFADRYPNSRLLDSFWYMMGYGHFELENPQEALQICRKVAEASFPVPETGGTRPADNRWEAIYIMGQVYHSLGQAANAIAEYTKVKDRFADAAEAIHFFTRKSIKVDEVTTIQPDAAKEVELRFRNVEEVVIKVYRIDLMKFGLMQRTLDRITAINLAGIRPHHEATVKLGDGRDFRDRSQPLSLPLEQEGAYLLVCRGGSLYTSGLVLVTPLTLQVQEDAESGRVRVSVKNVMHDDFVSDVHVKVIGSANDDFASGETDLRGLFIADDIQGTSTIIAANDEGHYAFFRGDTFLQRTAQPFGSGNDPFDAPVQQAEPAFPKPAMQQAEMGKKSLRDNLFRQNSLFQEEQQGNYQDLMNNDRSGIKSKEAF
jgi:TolA-binding protein